MLGRYIFEAGSTPKLINIYHFAVDLSEEAFRRNRLPFSFLLYKAILLESIIDLLFPDVTQFNQMMRKLFAQTRVVGQTLLFVYYFRLKAASPNE